MDIGSLIYWLIPADVVHSPWFIASVIGGYAVLSCLQSFVKDPKYGWLAKYDDPIQTVLGILGVWNKKSYSLMQVRDAAKSGGMVSTAPGTTTNDDPMKDVGKL